MKAAIIGNGSIGQRHSHNFARLGYDVAVWDANPTRCTVPTQKEALDGATLAVIATPPAAHLEGAIAADQAGVPWVLVEKPLAMTVKQAEALRALSATIFVGYCLRTAYATRRLLEELPKIGPIRIVEAVYSEKPARSEWVYECGAVLEYSHILDLLLLCFGTPIRVASTGGPDACVAGLTWLDGARGTLRMDFYSRKETRLRIIGDRGDIHWRRECLEGADEAIGFENPAAWLLHEAQELHAVINGAPVTNKLCTLEEGIQVMEFAERLSWSLA